jgi:peroxiredoxin
MELYKRITLIVKDGKIIKYFYPVFPPDKNAEEVLEWIVKNEL